MISEDTQCSFVLDNEWREEHDLDIEIDEEVADEDGNWHCLRRAGDGDENCIFHQDPEDRKRNGVNDIEVAQALVDAVHGASQRWAIVGADEMTAREQARREKQFLGATFGDLQLSHQVVNAPDKYPIDLRGATVGELNIPNALASQPSPAAAFPCD